MGATIWGGAGGPRGWGAILRGYRLGMDAQDREACVGRGGRRHQPRGQQEEEAARGGTARAVASDGGRGFMAHALLLISLPCHCRRDCRWGARSQGARSSTIHHEHANALLIVEMMWGKGRGL